MKSLEVSEEKANQRVEEFKREMKTLTVRLKEAENRAEQAEKQVKRLQKEVDRLEGTCPKNYTLFHFLYKIYVGKLSETVVESINNIFINICTSIGCKYRKLLSDARKQSSSLANRSSIDIRPYFMPL